MVLELAPEKIFFDWSSNQKMRFLLSHLPASPPPCYLARSSRPRDGTEASAIEAAGWQPRLPDEALKLGGEATEIDGAEPFHLQTGIDSGASGGVGER
jgi:hypothetical protein